MIATKKYAPMCADLDVDGVFNLLASLVKLTRRDAAKGDPEARRWLAELTDPSIFVHEVTGDEQVTPHEIINHQAAGGLARRQAAATHVWPRGRASPAEPKTPAPGSKTTPPAAPAAPAAISRDLSLDPDKDAIDGVAVTVAASVAPVRKPGRTIERKILAALNESPGRWYTTYDLVVATGTARGSLAKALTRLIERRPGTVQRVADGPQSFRYRLINSVGI